MGTWRGGKPAGPLSPLGFGVTATVVVLDQIAKFAAQAYVPLGEAIDLLPFLTLYRVANSGIAFSFFAGSGMALIVVMLVVSAVVTAFWIRTHEGGRLAAIGFALILGGALGNLIDRVRLGYVVDYLLLHFGDWTLFVFNLADAALTLGPALLILVHLFPGKATASPPR